MFWYDNLNNVLQIRLETQRVGGGGVRNRNIFVEAS